MVCERALSYSIGTIDWVVVEMIASLNSRVTERLIFGLKLKADSGWKVRRTEPSCVRLRVLDTAKGSTAAACAWRPKSIFSSLRL